MTWPRGVLAALLTVLLVSSAGAGAAAHADVTPREPAFTVALHGDGSARVTLTVAFDLATDSERQAFERLQRNETARAELRRTFVDRLDGVAARAENATGREMALIDPAVSFRASNGTGRVDISVTWTGLARTDGSRVVLAEPFAGGFSPQQSFTVHAPEGYALTTVEPSPAEAGDTRARWTAGTTIDGFRVVATPAAESADVTPTAGAGDGTDAAGGAGAGSPGFGALGVLAALALLVLAARRAG